MRLERREQPSLLLAALAPFAAVAASLVICAGLIALAGVNPLDAYAAMLRGAFGSTLSITETLARATPLVLTGLAATVAFRARLWNIGAEGQLYMGALAAAWLGSEALAGWPPLLGIAGIMVAGMVAGAVMLLVPAFLRVRFGVDEVVTTLLANFIVMLFVGMMVEGPLKDPLAFGWPQSVPVADPLMLGKLVPRTRLHVGALMALAAAGLCWLMLARTVFGTRARAAGLSPGAAGFAGVSIPRTLLAVAAISGALAGLAGAIEVAGVKGYVTTDLSPGYGYSGIVVAMLAGLHPAGVVLAAVFVAVVFVGADAMSRALGAPSFIADVIVAVSLLTMLTAVMFASWRVRR